MNIFLLNFTLSFLLGLILINTAKKYKLILQNRHQNIQKVHTNFIPRLGGICLISFYTIFLFDVEFLYNNFSIYFFIPLLIIMLGFIEDISDSMNSKIRALLSSLIIIILILNSNYFIKNIDIEIIDQLLKYNFFSYFFMFGCLFISVHAFNLIDGMNGLCSGYSLIILIILTYLFNLQNLTLLSLISISLIGSILGFFVLNFPYPKIFLGDSGSYFLGLIIGILSIISFNKLSNVSPWFFALLYTYPITEFLFSFARRLINRKNPFQSDFKHLHSIIYLLIKQNKYFKDLQLINSISTLVIINLFSYQIIIALLFLNNKNILIFIIFISMFVYFLSYTIFTKLIKNI